MLIFFVLSEFYHKNFEFLGEKNCNFFFLLEIKYLNGGILKLQKNYSLLKKKCIKILNSYTEMRYTFAKVSCLQTFEIFKKLQN